MLKILITGGTGTIGQALQDHFRSLGHEVRILTTSPSNKSKHEFAFSYDIKNFTIELEALRDVDIFIHLAGANIGKKAWTPKYKKEIIDSRVKTCELVHHGFQEIGHFPSTVISLSGIAYYEDPSDPLLTESSPKGSGFLSDVCEQWEKAPERFLPQSRLVIYRTAPVLTAKEGLLDAFMMTANLRVIPTTGNAKNWLSWIALPDVVKATDFAINNKEVAGIYNLTSLHPVQQKDFVKSIDKALHKKSLHPNVPRIALKLMLGERAALALTSQQVQPQRLISSGFQFQFENIDATLKAIL